MRNKQGMTLIVKTMARTLSALIFLYGLYIVFHGHLTPGGGFAGGVIMAGAVIFVVLAYGKEGIRLPFGPRGAGILESVGGLTFLCLGLLGFTAGYFLANFLPRGELLTLKSGGVIPLINVGIGLKVLGVLFCIFAAFAPGWIKEDEEE